MTRGGAPEPVRGGRANRTRRLLTAFVVALISGGSAAAAVAQDIPTVPDDPASAGPDPYATCETGALADQCPDTDQTPGAGDTQLFQLLHGAAWKESDNDPVTKVVLGSATDFDDDLYTVAFSPQQGVGGFAGGANCEVSEENHESGCVPVIYQYRIFDPAHGAEWRKVSLPGSDEPGYVGAMAWISNTGEALAVGGTGVYPRRDPAYKEECQEWETLEDAPGVTTGQRKRLIGAWGQKCDPAGSARAWIYNRGGKGRWEEITDELPTEDTEQNVAANRGVNYKICIDASTCPEAGTPDQAPLAEPAKTLPRRGMAGLTALDCNPALAAEFCFAGGLGQLWKWENGRFTADDGQAGRVDAQSEASELSNANRFRFRVRQIQFVKGFPNEAVAVTSGCCAEGQGQNVPAILFYNSPSAAPARWSAVSLAWGGDLNPPTAGLGPAPRDAVEPATRSDARQQRPDSFYSVTARLNPGGLAGTTPVKLSAVASPGGDPSVYQAGEPPSQITSRYCTTEDGQTTLSGPGGLGGTYEGLLYDGSNLTRLGLGTTRLVAGDGDRSNDSFQGISASTPGGVFGLDAKFKPESIDFLRHYRGSPASYSYADFLSCGSREREANSPDTDAVPDWVVGELRSTATGRPGAGTRGLLWANPLRPGFMPDAIRSPVWSEPQGGIDPTGNGMLGKYSTVPTSELTGGYTPTSPEKLQAWARAPYFLLPSYGLNAIDVIGDTASGWVVGDHGAILSLNGEALTKETPEPDPPKLGGRRPASLPGGSAYQAASPAAASEAAPVASLAGQPTMKLEEPAMFPAGSPDPSGTGTLGYKGTSVRSIAISRDGHEGWAVGPLTESGGGIGWAATTLYHYDGSSWSLCDMKGVPGQLPADPACAEVAGIGAFADHNGVTQSVRLRAISRVPLEKDRDPSNDDEFEAVAVGSAWFDRPYQPGSESVPVILRYRDGRWTFEDPGAREEVTRSAVGLLAPTELGGGGNTGLIDVAFTAPDDGWALARTGSGGGAARLFRFDGTRWTRCSPPPAPDTCSDPDGHLSQDLNLAIVAGGGPGLGLLSAGERVYLYGNRINDTTSQRCPVVLYHDRGGGPWHGSFDGQDGSLDPGFDPAARAARACDSQPMLLDSLAVGQRFDSSYEGWIFGEVTSGRLVEFGTTLGQTTEQRLLHLEPGHGWERFEDSDALGDYFTPRTPMRSETAGMIPNGAGGLDAFTFEGGRLFRFDPDGGRWELVDSAADPAGNSGADVLSDDGEGGFWAARGVGYPERQHFLHYTDHPRRPVFTNAPNPAGTAGYITAAAAGANGQLWLGTNSDILYRYDRATGWDRVRISGWDPGRVVTRPSETRAIAVNESGEGVAVGEKGRIADISGGEVTLDQAAGTLCDQADVQPPCGTGRDLRAASVSPQGAAMVAGGGLALLWRPPGEPFRAIAKPDAAAQTTVTGVSMPAENRAYLTTQTGLLFRGDMGGPGQWSWTHENTNEKGDTLTLDPSGSQLSLSAVAVDALGHGFAVGEQGLVLERTGDGGHPWRRLRTGFLDNFTSVALPQGGGSGALLGGERGVIYSWDGRAFQLARAPDITGVLGSAAARFEGQSMLEPVAGLAFLPGVEPGQVEAWAALQGAFTAPEGPSSLLHYSSDSSEPLLEPEQRVAPLPDAAPPREGELSFASFGGIRCMNRPDGCPDMALTSEDFETYTKRIVSEIAARSGEPGGPAFALFSGDMTDGIGLASGDSVQSPLPSFSGGDAHAPTTAQIKLRRFADLVADRLEAEHVPVFAALGGGDISSPPGGQASAGDNFTWRAMMASRRAPWGVPGSDSPPAGDGLTFEPVPDGPHAVRPDDQPVPREAGAAGGSGTAGDAKLASPTPDGPLGETRVRTGGASTHYAVDVSRDGKRIARLVFLDSSLRSVSTATATQNPIEPQGQLDWLDRVLCSEGQGSDSGEPCTRSQGEPAIVVSNTPTYSYGPGTLSGTELGDAAQLEQVLLQGNATAVVSGRIGWNGLYYARGAGNQPVDHVPAPGDSYPTGPPEALPGGNPPLPFVVASGAGRFSQDARDTSAPAGFWHGYTIVRLDPSGDPAKAIVEQRPVFDWLQLSGTQRVLRAGQKLTLHGVGREPVATSSTQGGKRFEVRDDEISTPAITHRYDLLVGDPDRPWLPLEADDDGVRDQASARLGESDPCGHYLCLDPKTGTVDDQSGQVKAGNGQYPRTFAIAQLSVGEQVAIYPLVFEPRASFKPPVPPPPVPVAVPAPASPPAPAQPTTPSVNLPAAPVLPVLTAQALAPPPVPPAPPTFASEAPLDLNLSPAALDASPPTAVSQPPTPPVNPAPPSGARREARQRQAAAQKSGADSDQESSEAQELGGDTAEAPHGPGHAATRHDFTAIAHREQPSAWARDALLGAGLGIAALLLALGANTARPTPRRREPELPAPAWARGRRGR